MAKKVSIENNVNLNDHPQIKNLQQQWEEQINNVR